MRQSFRYRGTTPRQAFFIIILLFVLLVSLLVGFLSWHNHIIYQGNIVIVSNDKEESQIQEEQENPQESQEIDEEIDEAVESVDYNLSNISNEVSKEVLGFMENKLDNIITDIDNSKNFAELEENIVKIAMSKIDKKKLVRLAQKLGQDYVDDLRKKGYAKIRTTINKKYDDEYIDEIVSKVLPKLMPYYKDILRKYVLDSIYSKITDEVLEVIADAILNDLRTEYATKLREESEKMVDDFLLKLDNIDDDSTKQDTKSDENPPKNNNTKQALDKHTPKILPPQPQTPKTRLNRQN